MAEILIPGGGIFSEPTTSGEYLVPGIGIISVEDSGAGGAIANVNGVAGTGSAGDIIASATTVVIASVDGVQGNGSAGSISVPGGNLEIVSPLQLKNKSGTVLASISDLNIYVHDYTTEELITSFTDQSTDATGRFSINSLFIAPGVTYSVKFRRTSEPTHLGAAFITGT